MSEPNPSHPGPDFFEELGRLCAAWAYLEAGTDCAIWGMLKLDKTTGPHITWRLDMRGRWSMLMSISKTLVDKAERQALVKLNTKVEDLNERRNLYVHGLVASYSNATQFYQVVFRGKMQGKLQPTSAKLVQTTREEIQDVATQMAAFNRRLGYVFAAIDRPST